MALSNIKVKKDELIRRIKANRTTHMYAWAEAHEAWRAVYQAALVGFAARVANGHTGVPGELRRFGADNQEPKNHRRDYDAALEMLEMSTEDEIVIDGYGFRQLVRDEWDWKADFAATNQKYSGTA